jgi:hypothetical protein
MSMDIRRQIAVQRMQESYSAGGPGMVRLQMHAFGAAHIVS